MTQRFDELYIPRREHQQIVTYYKKLVVHVYQKLRALQAERGDATPVDQAGNPEPKTRTIDADAPPDCGNGVRGDFRRQRRSGR